MAMLDKESMSFLWQLLVWLLVIVKPSNSQSYGYPSLVYAKDRKVWSPTGRIVIMSCIYGDHAPTEDALVASVLEISTRRLGI